MDVLLATFNGEKYLEEQLESLDRQEDVNVRVWANDDGSVDNTLNILHKWQKRGLIKGISKTSRVGSTRGFLGLLSERSDSEYVAFCDQDDLWDPRKLIYQIKKMSGDDAQMVFSRRDYINDQNQKVGQSTKPRRKISLNNAVIENSAPGNTQMLNRQAVKFINQISHSKVQHYDAWTYLLINAIGECKYIDMPLVRYRIHDENAVGVRKFDIRRILCWPDPYYNQALNLVNAINETVFEENFTEVDQFLKFVEEPKRSKRIIKSFCLDFYRQRKFDNLIMIITLIVRAPKESPSIDC